jgi:uncharacterized protein with FMN-binding domain
MPNVSRRPGTPDHTPSRIPRRGAVAALATTAGLALLLSFKTPNALPTMALGPGTLQATTPSNGDNALASLPQPAVSAGPTPGTSVTPAPSVALSPIVAPSPTSGQEVIAGDVIDTRFGSVQVQVTLSNGVLIDVQALQLPDSDRHSAQISDEVAPYLRQMALEAQSADIDLISGATYTSDGYARSLQSALDAAGA